MKYKLSQKVMTMRGQGIVKNAQYYERQGMWRYGVELLKAPFIAQVVYFFEEEVCEA